MPEQLNYYLVIFVPLTLLVALINLFYNTLLTNLRLLAKIHSTTWGLCIFDLFNKICCYKCCRKPCQDRCCTPWLFFKWFLTVVWVLLTIKVVRDQQDEWDDKASDYIVEYEARFQTRLDTYLIIYMCQLPIFIAARLPIFCVYSIFTCCCIDDEREWELNVDQMKELLISYDYVQYHLERL